ncbi:hypothetical protein PL9214650049 [Planktothrix tepida PCC 9214]|uniref:Uncharacterized protein n=1 Tax=Planktothrix tepida PCC 9214 TaxID=671072 RepID=A0A1J1LRI2_9CYAN|nr:hypothetical protein PL9214650049 [Planktothrix tepida PCC 9214]
MTIQQVVSRPTLLFVKFPGLNFIYSNKKTFSGTGKGEGNFEARKEFNGI